MRADTAGEISGLEGEEFDISKGEAYDASAIKAYKDDGTELKATEATFTVDPQTADIAGDYTAIARVSVPANYSIGGGAIADFTVKRRSSTPRPSTCRDLQRPELRLHERRRLRNQIHRVRPSSPSSAVSCEGKALAAGTDYTVSYANEANGDAVDSMVDSGAYTVTIALANGYVFADSSTTLSSASTSPAAHAYRRHRPSCQGRQGPALHRLRHRASFEGSYVDMLSQPQKVTLDPSWYTVSSLYYTDQALEAKVRQRPSSRSAATPPSSPRPTSCVNYTWNADVEEVEFKVVENAYFDDVASDAWYADEVAKAKALEDVDGMGNNLSSPRAEMTPRPVRPGALQHGARARGRRRARHLSDPVLRRRVHGLVRQGRLLGGRGRRRERRLDTEFEPEGKITREQIATMLYRYASNGAEADLSVLDQFADAESVSDWAKEAMAWAVEEGHMNGRGGDGLQPQGNATRAEVAALSVRVQPERYTDPA